MARLSQDSEREHAHSAGALARVEANAAAEYGAEFRRDIESLIAPEVIEAATVPHRGRLPPALGIRYHAFVDPAGGSGGDSFTVAIGQRD